MQYYSVEGEPSQFNDWLAKPKTLEELLKWEKGKTVDYGDIPNEFKNNDRGHFIDMLSFDSRYQITDLNIIIDYIYDHADDIPSSYEDGEIDYDFIYNQLEQRFPGLANYLIKEEITTIIFDW